MGPKQKFIATKATKTVPDAARKAVMYRRRSQLAELDYKRALRTLQPRLRQREIADLLEIKQPSVSAALKQAETVDLPREGFSGASPYEICQRYADEQISHEELLDELGRWEYAQGDVTDGYDTLLVDPPGTFHEVGAALDRGLISEEDYDNVLERVAGTM